MFGPLLVRAGVRVIAIERRLQNRRRSALLATVEPDF